MEPEALAEVRARLERVLATLVADGRVPGLSSPRAVDDLRGLLAEIDRRAALPGSQGRHDVASRYAKRVGSRSSWPRTGCSVSRRPALGDGQGFAGNRSTSISAERPQMRTPYCALAGWAYKSEGPSDRRESREVLSHLRHRRLLRHLLPAPRRSQHGRRKPISNACLRTRSTRRQATRSRSCRWSSTNAPKNYVATWTKVRCDRSYKLPHGGQHDRALCLPIHAQIAATETRLQGFATLSLT